MLAGEARGRAGGETGIIEHRPECTAGQQHRRGVKDVLTRRAQVDIRSQLLTHSLAQGSHQRHHRRSVFAALATQGRQVKPVTLTSSHDRLRGGGGNEVRPCAGACEGGLDIEHCPKPRRIATRAAAAPRAYVPVNRPSDGKEDGLARPLQPNVEPVAIIG